MRQNGTCLMSTQTDRSCWRNDAHCWFILYLHGALICKIRIELLNYKVYGGGDAVINTLYKV